MQKWIDNFDDGPVSYDVTAFLDGELEAWIQTAGLAVRSEKGQERFSACAHFNFVDPDVLMNCAIDLAVLAFEVVVRPVA